MDRLVVSGSDNPTLAVAEMVQGENSNDLVVAGKSWGGEHPA